MLRKTRPQTAPRTRFLRSFHRFWVVILRIIIGFSAVILGGDAPNYLNHRKKPFKLTYSSKGGCLQMDCYSFNCLDDV